jgi:hypothetical protein
MGLEQLPRQVEVVAEDPMHDAGELGDAEIKARRPRPQSDVWNPSCIRSA